MNNIYTLTILVTQSNMGRGILATYSCFELVKETKANDDKQTFFFCLIMWKCLSNQTQVVSPK